MQKSKFIKLLVDHKINPTLAVSICEYVRLSDEEDFIEDLKKVAEAEQRMYLRLGLFSSDFQYLKYMEKEKIKVYSFYLELVKKLHKDRHDSIVAEFRLAFKNTMLSNNSRIAWKAFWWDHLWLEDELIRKHFYSYKEKSTKKELLPGKNIRPPYIEFENYNKKLLFPLLTKAVYKYGEMGNHVLADYIHLLDITFCKRSTLEKSFLLGNDKKHEGLLHFNNKSNAKSFHPILMSRIDKAMSLFFDGFIQEKQSQSKWVSAKDALVQKLKKYSR